eukprot:2566530-Prymnesium_polylepis.1
MTPDLLAPHLVFTAFLRTCPNSLIYVRGPGGARTFVRMWQSHEVCPVCARGPLNIRPTHVTQGTRSA